MACFSIGWCHDTPPERFALNRLLPVTSFVWHSPWQTGTLKWQAGRLKNPQKGHQPIALSFHQARKG
eukprot:scaffold11982_cov89-Cylindrotheca_fusiformis.AAC.3